MRESPLLEEDEAPTPQDELSCDKLVVQEPLPESSSTKIARLLWEEVERQRARCDRLVGQLKLEMAGAVQEASAHWATSLEYRKKARQLTRELQESSDKIQSLKACNAQLQEALLVLQRDRGAQAQKIKWLQGATLSSLQQPGQDEGNAHAAHTRETAANARQADSSGTDSKTKACAPSSFGHACADQSTRDPVSILATVATSNTSSNRLIRPCAVRNFQICHHH